MNENAKREVLREAKILEVLKHPNIIGFRDVYKTKNGKMSIVMDYADGGDLHGMIKKKKLQGELWNEDHILNWFTQICLALKHIHDRKIMHRDLKSHNVFLTKNGVIKLGDFGVAKVFNSTISKALS